MPISEPQSSLVSRLRRGPVGKCWCANPTQRRAARWPRAVDRFLGLVRGQSCQRVQVASPLFTPQKPSSGGTWTLWGWKVFDKEWGSLLVGTTRTKATRAAFASFILMFHSGLRGGLRQVSSECFRQRNYVQHSHLYKSLCFAFTKYLSCNARQKLGSACNKRGTAV